MATKDGVKGVKRTSKEWAEEFERLNTLSSTDTPEVRAFKVDLNGLKAEFDRRLEEIQ